MSCRRGAPLRLALFLTLCLCLLGTVASGRPAVAAPDGEIRGQIRDGSIQGQAVAGAEVTLHLLDNGADHTLVTTVSDAQGGYRFAGVETAAAGQYRVTAAYRGVPYASIPVSFTSGLQQVTDVTVYDTIENDSAIRVERLTIVLARADPQQKLLTAVESYRVRNDGLSTYIGDAGRGQRESLRFALFAGAGSLVPVGGFNLADAVATPNGFALTLPVQPGASTYAFTYQVPYRGTSAQLDHSLAYPTALAQLIQSNGLSVSSPQLTGHNAVDLNGRSFDTIEAKELAAGSGLRLTLTGLPAGSQSPLPLDSLQTQVLLVSLAAGAAAVAVVLSRRWLRSATQVALLQERGRLLHRVAALDDRFEAGRVGRETYERERARVKARLLEIGAIVVAQPEQPRSGQDKVPASEDGEPSRSD